MDLSNICSLERDFGKVIGTNYLSPPNCNGSFVHSKILGVRTPITWVSRAARFVIALLINLRRSANSLCYLSWYTCMILLEINPQPIWDVILVILVYILVCILVCVSPNEFVWPSHFHLNYYPSCRTQDSFAAVNMGNKSPNLKPSWNIHCPTDSRSQL